MISSTYRWPAAFALVSLTACAIAFLIPSLVGSSVVGGIAAVFFVLALISIPTAVRTDATGKSQAETMETTLGASK